jgi:serine/threonine protein phosphatase PrpC
MKTHQYIDSEMTSPEMIELPHGVAMALSCSSPAKTSGNEDCASVISVNKDISLLVVADGLGGRPNGAAASTVLVETLEEAISNVKNSNADIRGTILNCIEAVNLDLLQKNTGEGTTVAIVELNNNSIRSYHVGDSEIMIIDSRGNTKYQTLSHSPIAYAVESGFIDEDLAIAHEDRHYISNYIGDPGMHISVATTALVNKQDTLLLGTDGLFDNLFKHEIGEIVLEMDIEKVAQNLKDLASTRMGKWKHSIPSKPDDLTFILYRPN